MLRAVFHYECFMDWSFDDVIKQWGLTLGSVIFTWDWDESRRYNATNILYNEIYERDFPPVWTTPLGILGVILRACGSLHEFAMINLLFIIGLSFRKYTAAFTKVIRSTKNRNQWGFPGVSGSPIMDKLWNFYQSIRTTSQEINNCYGIWMKSLHVNNLMMLAFFILLCVIDEHSEVTFISYLYIISITLYSYYIASSISDTVWLNIWPRIVFVLVVMANITLLKSYV